MKKILVLAVLLSFTTFAFGATAESQPSQTVETVQSPTGFSTEVNKVIDCIVAKTGMAADKAIEGFKLLAAEYQTGCIIFTIIGAMLILVAALSALFFFPFVVHSAQKLEYENKPANGAIAKCFATAIISLLCLIFGIVLSAQNIYGALMPHVSLLGKIVR